MAHLVSFISSFSMLVPILLGSAQHVESGVVELTSDDEYEAAMKDVADKDARAVVDFTATWCGPCELHHHPSPGCPNATSIHVLSAIHLNKHRALERVGHTICGRQSARRGRAWPCAGSEGCSLSAIDRLASARVQAR